MLFCPKIVDCSLNPPEILILFICCIETQSMEKAIALAPFLIFQNVVTTSYASYAAYLYLLLSRDCNIDIGFMSKKLKMQETKPAVLLLVRMLFWAFWSESNG